MPDIDYKKLKKDLLDPSSYPDKNKAIRLVETHISMVFIGDRYVYKIKKPVNFGFLDFTTLDKRRYYCKEEIRLNRRLAEDIYIELLPVVFDGKRYAIGMEEDAKVVDFAVKMRRIPEDRLMKEMFLNGNLRDEDLKSVAMLLSRFHLNADSGEGIEEYGLPSKIRINTDENFSQVEPFIGKTIDSWVFNYIKDWTEEFYKRNERLFYKRIEDKKIRDCHGDLHMEHVAFLKEPVIIDCIEFNSRFRFGDILNDMAFILMDMEFHGGWKEAERLWSYYMDLTGEQGMEELLCFYKVYRAFVRGKVIGFQFMESQSEELREKAKRYFDLALNYIKQ